MKQFDLFRSPPPPLPPVSPLTRPPKEARAGTRIDHRFSVEIFAKQPKTGRYASAGWVDKRQRFFQGGGELANFMYFKRRLLTFQRDVWQQLVEQYADVLDFVELVDHSKVRCFRVDFATACTEGEWYADKIGPRYGVPIDLWIVDTTVYAELPKAGISLNNSN